MLFAITLPLHFKELNMELCYCFLEKFNNYFNRKIIKYESINDYIDHAKDSFIPIASDGNKAKFNFNPNDNVMTEIIANSVPFDPDYFLLIDDNEAIIQRWFVLEQKRNREGQWVYTLRRDVVADNFNELLEAPVFVEKGMLKEDDPFIVNNEGMNLNQIKKSETLLKDKSQTAWIVGYMAKNIGGADISIQVGSESIDVDYDTLTQIASDMGITEAALINRINFDGSNSNISRFTNHINMTMYLMVDTPLLPIDHYYYYGFGFSPDFNELTSASLILNYDIFVNPYLFRSYQNLSEAQLIALKNNYGEAVVNNKSQWLSDMPSILNRDYYMTNDQLQTLKKYNGTLIKYLGNYYRLNILETGTESIEKENILNNGIYQALTDTTDYVISASTYPLESLNSYELAKLRSDETLVSISMELVSLDDTIPQLSTKISSSRKTTGDQEYDIFAIPLTMTINTGTPYDTVESFSRRIASAISREQDAKVYDLQLLPYCPIPEMVSGNNYIDVQTLTVDEDYNLITYHKDGNDYNCGIIFYIQNASFSTIIEKSITSSKSKKVLSNCYKWRLNSPNYQGAFDFNLALNGGRVLYFNVFCTYKPFSPVIKVAPNFEWLYGAEYQDNRGLICGGDFSLPRVSDAWINYELNNKNYQNIFNRDIQHLEFMQGIEMRNQIISGAVGILGDTVKGGTAGAIAGGPYGAIAGAVVGGATSAVGYAIDVDTMARTHRENKQLAIDKYNYQLGNIKALPYTLTKVGSFDIISKIFPFIEEYCCSDEELKAFENKIRYESMIVMRIGTIKEFSNFNSNLNYFKGSLIRCDDIADDTHLLNAIYEELLKGVYI